MTQTVWKSKPGDAKTHHRVRADLRCLTWCCSGVNSALKDANANIYSTQIFRFLDAECQRGKRCCTENLLEVALVPRSFHRNRWLACKHSITTHWAVVTELAFRVKAAWNVLASAIRHNFYFESKCSVSSLWLVGVCSLHLQSKLQETAEVC